MAVAELNLPLLSHPSTSVLSTRVRMCLRGGHIRRGKVEMRHVGGKLQIVDGNIASGIFVCQEVAIVGIIHGCSKDVPLPVGTATYANHPL